MTLMVQQVVEIVRQRLGDKDASNAAKYIAQINTALKETSRQMAADPFLRELLKTDSSLCRYPLDSDAQINLTQLYDDFQILLEYFNLGQCYLEPSLVATVAYNCPNSLVLEPYTEGFANGDNVTFSVGAGGVLPVGLAVDTTYVIQNYTLTETSATFGLNTGASDSCGDVIDVELLSAGTAPILMTRLDSGSGLPMQQIHPQQAALPNYLASLYDYYTIQGNLMNVAPPTTGFVRFSVPRYAKNLADLPASKEVESLFLQVLIDLIAQPAMPVET